MDKLKILLLLFFTAIILSAQSSREGRKIDSYFLQHSMSISNLYNISYEDVYSSNLFAIPKNNFQLKRVVKSNSLLKFKEEFTSIPLAEQINVTNSDDQENSKEESKSFFKSEIFYFACAAVLAGTIYAVWSKSDNPQSTTKTFGKPPVPQN